MSGRQGGMPSDQISIVFKALDGIKARRGMTDAAMDREMGMASGSIKNLRSGWNNLGPNHIGAIRAFIVRNS